MLAAAATTELAHAFRACAVPLSKTATIDDTSTESEPDARSRRVAELLRRRQPSGLADGSASPTPPRDSS